MPKVSVIVPVYNKEKYIGRCIESIQNQSMKDWELILVDDCSTDRSLHIMNDYASRDDRIIVRHQVENHGPMIARHLGDEMAKGDYITYCDADDWLPNSALQNLYEESVTTGADIVNGNYEFYKTNGTKTKTDFSLKYGNGSEGVLKSVIKRQIPQCLWGKLYQATLLKNYKYEVFDHMTNAEDGYMFYQILLHVKKMVQISDIVYIYVQIPDSSTQNKYVERALDNICLFNSLRIRYISLFPNLKSYIIASVSESLVNLKYKGNNNHGVLEKILKKYELMDFCSNKTILQYHPFIKALKLLIKNNCCFC